MNKIQHTDYLTILDDFKKSHNITDSNFDYYAALKFINETFMKDFYELSLVKTANENHPILLKNYSRLVQKTKDNTFESMDKSMSSSTDYVQIIKENDRDYLTKIHNALESSKGFKDFINQVNVVFKDDPNFSNLGSHLNNNPVFRIAQEFNALNAVIAEKDESQQPVKHVLENIISVIGGHTHLTKEFRLYNLAELYRDYFFSYEASKPESNRTHDGMMNKYYDKFDEAFEFFKRRQCMKLGLLLHSKTENQLLDTPELNAFIDLLKTNYPRSFKSHDESIEYTITDDATIKASGATLQSQQSDFSLFHIGFIGSSMPNLIPGYSYFPKHYMENMDENHIHICGDNAFFKVYYHYLELDQKDDFKICIAIDTNISAVVDQSNITDYLRPALEYLENNKILMKLAGESDIFKYIEKDELANMIKSDYPNLIHTLNVKKYVDLIEFDNAKTYQDVQEIYKKINDDNIKPELNKTIKNKI